MHLIVHQEHLSLVKNKLERLYGELTELSCLRTLNIRHNNIKSSGIPAELFHLEELTTLDLSHNNLKEVPEGLERARSLLNLNLSHNWYVSTTVRYYDHRKIIEKALTLFLFFQYRNHTKYVVHPLDRLVVLGS